MKINKISVDREYSGITAVSQTVLINFDSSSDDIQSKALYYAICAVDKMRCTDYNELSLPDKMQVDARLDAAIEMFQQMRK